MGEDRSWRVALVPNTLYLAAPLLRGYCGEDPSDVQDIFADIHYDCPNESLERVFPPGLFD